MKSPEPDGIEIRVDDLSGPEIARLLESHLKTMAQYSPPENVFALDLDALRSPNITFWTVWDGENLIGCGALRELDGRHGEIKSMHTIPAYRGKGIAQRMLTHIVAEAASRSYGRLSLETGSGKAFAPAFNLYARNGFVETEPFGDYEANPFSRFLTRELTCDGSV